MSNWFKRQCKVCDQTIPNRRSSVDIDTCRHCYQKQRHGVVDIKTCFQGSVITLEDE